LSTRRKLDLRKTMFLLPNIITLSSIFCGFDSIRLSASAQGDDDYYRASLLLIFALFFDMLDGRVARLTKTQSAFGLQIDSLADVVSFGVAPAISLQLVAEAARCRARLRSSSRGRRRAPRAVQRPVDGRRRQAHTKPGKYIVAPRARRRRRPHLFARHRDHAIAGALSSPATSG
jgi:hypothetical protein